MPDGILGADVEPGMRRPVCFSLATLNGEWSVVAYRLSDDILDRGFPDFGWHWYLPEGEHRRKTRLGESRLEQARSAGLIVTVQARDNDGATVLLAARVPERHRLRFVAWGRLSTLEALRHA